MPDHRLTEQTQGKSVRYTPDDLEGARIEYVERQDNDVWVIAWGFHGTDDGSGYMHVRASDIHFADE